MDGTCMGGDEEVNRSVMQRLEASSSGAFRPCRA